LRLLAAMFGKCFGDRKARAQVGHTLVLDRLGLLALGHDHVQLLERNHDDAVCIAHDDVAGVDLDSLDLDRLVH